MSMSKADARACATRVNIHLRACRRLAARILESVDEYKASSCTDEEWACEVARSRDHLHRAVAEYQRAAQSLVDGEGEHLLQKPLSESDEEMEALLAKVEEKMQELYNDPAMEESPDD